MWLKSLEVFQRYHQVEPCTLQLSIAIFRCFVIWVCFISGFGKLGFSQFSLILRNLSSFSSWGWDLVNWVVKALIEC